MIFPVDISRPTRYSVAPIIWSRGAAMMAFISACTERQNSYLSPRGMSHLLTNAGADVDAVGTTSRRTVVAGGYDDVVLDDDRAKVAAQTGAALECNLRHVEVGELVLSRRSIFVSSFYIGKPVRFDCVIFTHRLCGVHDPRKRYGLSGRRVCRLRTAGDSPYPRRWSRRVDTCGFYPLNSLPLGIARRNLQS